MRLCFIGSGIEREDTHLNGVEVKAVATVMASRFDTLVYGGSSVGLMEAFATAFADCGGQVLGVVPPWLEEEGLVHPGCERIYCESLAARKHAMFDAVDAVLCYPGGIGTWDELFDLLARWAVQPELTAPPVYLYNWEKYYAPLLLQLETAVEAGLLRPEIVRGVHPFETVEGLAELLSAVPQTSVDQPRRSMDRVTGSAESETDLPLDQETPFRV